jgi:hypothetical protein
MEIDTDVFVRFPLEGVEVCAVAKVRHRDGDDYGCQLVDVQAAVRRALDQAIYRYWRRDLSNTGPVL